MIKRCHLCISLSISDDWQDSPELGEHYNLGKHKMHPKISFKKFPFLTDFVVVILRNWVIFLILIKCSSDKCCCGLSEAIH